MPIHKAIPKKKSGRLLVSVRDFLYKEIKFEVWLYLNHPTYYEEERLHSLRRALVKLDDRIQRASARERMKESQLQLA